MKRMGPHPAEYNGHKLMIIKHSDTCIRVLLLLKIVNSIKDEILYNKL